MRAATASQVARLILQSWRNVIWTALGRSKPTAVAVCALAIAGVVFVGAVTVTFLVPAFQGVMGRQGGQAVLMALLYSNVAVLGALAFGGLFVMTPDLGALDRLLAAMPIRPQERYTGYVAPLLAVTYAVLSLLYAPAAIAQLRAAPASPGEAAWIVALLLGQIAYAVLLVALLNTAALGAMLRWLRVSERLARVAASALVALLIIGIAAIDLSRLAGAFHPVLSPLNAVIVLHEATARLSPGLLGPGRAVALLALLLALGLMLMAILWLARLVVQAEPKRRRLLVRSFLPMQGPGSALIVTELRLALRSPENQLQVGLYVVLTVLITALTTQLGTGVQSWAGVGLLLIAIVSSGLAVSAYGRTMRQRWILASAPIRTPGWLLAKVAGNLAYSLGVAVVLALPLVLAGWRPAGEGEVLLGALLVTTLSCAMIAVGTLLPSTLDTPMSSVLSTSLGLFVQIILLYGLGSAGALSEPVEAAGVTALCAIASYGVTVVADARNRDRVA